MRGPNPFAAVTAQVNRLTPSRGMRHILTRKNQRNAGIRMKKNGRDDNQYSEKLRSPGALISALGGSALICHIWKEGQMASIIAWTPRLPRYACIPYQIGQTTARMIMGKYEPQSPNDLESGISTESGSPAMSTHALEMTGKLIECCRGFVNAKYLALPLGSCLAG